MGESVIMLPSLIINGRPTSVVILSLAKCPEIPSCVTHYAVMFTV